MDRITRAQRSRVMARVRSSGNASTEMKLAAALKQARIKGWISHSKAIQGCPDFAFPRIKVAVFVDGCFWHGCPCCYRKPKSSQQYWQSKLERNVTRDSKIARALRQQGWSVLRVWEHSLRNMAVVLRRIRRTIEHRRHSRTQGLRSPQQNLRS